MRSLGSDNHSGVHPEVLKSLMSVNNNHEPSYGTDPISDQLKIQIESLFGKEWSSFLVFNGTAANVLCLKNLTESYNSIICSDVSHLNVDECGAPEKLLGSKLIALPSRSGKISPEDIKPHIIRGGDQHFSQPRVISITQPTELGTCYSLDELKALREFATKNNLKIHIDGARFSNAVSYLKSDFKTIANFADAVSFGGTKNGLLGCELVLVKEDKNLKFLRKQFMQLPSKTRFLAVQFCSYFSNNLYREIAESSCKSAKYLADQLEKKTGLAPNYPVESNAVFVNIPKNSIKKLKDFLFFYVWNQNTFEVRLMTSFDTKKDELDAFVELIKEEVEKN